MPILDLVSLFGGFVGLASMLVYLFYAGRKIGEYDQRLKKIEKDLIDKAEFGKFKEKAENSSNRIESLITMMMQEYIGNKNPEFVTEEKNPGLVVHLPSELKNYIDEQTIEHKDMSGFDIVKIILMDLSAKRPLFFLEFLRGVPTKEVVLTLLKAVEEKKAQNK